MPVAAWLALRVGVYAAGAAGAWLLGREALETTGREIPKLALSVAGGVLAGGWIGSRVGADEIFQSKG